MSWPYLKISSGLAKTVLQSTVKEKGKKKVDRKRDGKTMLRSGQEWTLLP